MHFANMPIQYAVIFEYIQMKKRDIFLIFAQNIDCVY